MRTAISTTDAPQAIGPYSQAVESGDVLWVSGQLGMDPAGTLAGDVAAQATQAMENLRAICKRAGYKLSNALRCTVSLVDLADFEAVNQVYAGFFKEPFPARACVQVAALPKGALVEIDAVVTKSSF
jgi:2-iminobutanoate/2-iminopropanoate deaminase